MIRLERRGPELVNKSITLGELLQTSGTSTDSTDSISEALFKQSSE